MSGEVALTLIAAMPNEIFETPRSGIHSQASGVDRCACKGNILARYFASIGTPGALCNVDYVR